jgi:diguanylate cyclase (GGDEF)-like protein
MDPTTVIIILAIHLTCSGGLFYLIGRQMPPRSGLGLWSGGAIAFGIAYLGRLATGLQGAQTLHQLLDAAMVLAALLFISGLRRFVGRPPLDWRMLGAVVALYLVAQQGVLAAWGPPGRYLLLNVSLGLLYAGLAAAAAASARREAAALRTPLLVLAVLMGGLAVLAVLRGVTIGIEGTATMYRSLQAQIFYVYASLAAVLLALNLLWMVFVRLNGQLAELAVRDPLTRVLNRNGLDDVLARHFAARGAPPVTLLQVDVDHFKLINDSHGHAVGDAVLCAVAASLTGHVRGSDFVARVGGEEFLVVCTGGDPAVPMALAERLRAGVGALEVPVAEGRSVRCTVSVGVSRRFAALADWQRAWHEADRALYAAKAAGRDRVIAFELAALGS